MQQYKILNDERDYIFQTDAPEEVVQDTLNLLKKFTMYDYGMLFSILEIIGFDCEEIKYIEIE